MEDFIEVVVDPLAMIVDDNGLPSFTSNLGVMCRVLKEGEECNMELTREQCITSSLITEEGFEASLVDFINAVLSVRATTTQVMQANLPPQAEAVPVESTSNHQPQGAVRRPLGELNRNSAITGEGASSGGVPNCPSPLHLLRDFQVQLTKLFEANHAEKAVINMDESEDPAAIPMVWVDKWVDYPEHGFSYELNDNTIGFNFNDLTKLLLLVGQQVYQYVERDGSESYYRLETYPSILDEKVLLLKRFRSYMDKNMIKAGAAIPSRVGNEKMTRPTFVRQWCKGTRAVALHLSDGTLQVNYFRDHVKLILCPLKGAVTVVYNRTDVRTFRLASLVRFGCAVELLERLEYVSEELINLFLTSESM